MGNCISIVMNAVRCSVWIWLSILKRLPTVASGDRIIMMATIRNGSLFKTLVGNFKSIFILRASMLIWWLSISIIFYVPTITRLKNAVLLLMWWQVRLVVQVG